jgi:putative transposase
VGLADRALLAVLLHRLPKDVLKRLHLVVRPDTVLRWHRDMVARRHARQSRPRRPGRPRTVRSIRALVLRLARENPGWGYRRVHGELLVLGVKVAASTVWEILHEAGIDPAPGRAATTWASFLRSQAEALVACDFFETVALSGTRVFVLAPHPPDPGAGRDRVPDRLLGGAGRPEPGHGPSGCWMPDAVFDPGAGRQVP